MARNRSLSNHARVLLAELLTASERGSYGYELASVTGIKSGTLYPLLIRLEAQGYLVADWQEPISGGRPPRHVYRLTAEGRLLARAEATALNQSILAGDWCKGGAAS